MPKDLSHTTVHRKDVDQYPIIYETSTKPPNVQSIARLFCRIQKDGSFDQWFYHQHDEYQPMGCSHSDFHTYYPSGFKTVGDFVCQKMTSGSILNNWTFSDWSFLQDDGSWRKWDTYYNPVTGKMNEFSPACLATFPYPLFFTFKACFLNRYEFILIVLENGDKTDKIRMNGYAGMAGWQRGISNDFSYEYKRFKQHEFILASEYLKQDYFAADVRSCDVDLLHVEHFSLSSDTTVEMAMLNSCSDWMLPQKWFSLSDEPRYKRNPFLYNSANQLVYF